mgnify:CR=1 FL=1
MKKFLSLVLALVMTMSLVTVSAGAKDFTDNSKINYKEAVDVMSAAKVIDGYAEGDFRPANTLTRGAAAKIICNLILGPTTAEALVADAAPYSDVPTTNNFAGYIAYCAKARIISGYADGTFRPAATLSGYAFMKMLLGALGYDATTEGYTGNNWSIQVAKRALSANVDLADGLNGEFNGIKAVTREEACLYAFNTLKATMVEYENSNSVTVNGITFTNKSTAKDMKNDTKTDGNIKDDGLMQFAEKYFSDLKGTPATDDLGHPSTKWMWKKDKIGTYANDADETYTLTGTYEIGTGKDYASLLAVLKDEDFTDNKDLKLVKDVDVYVNGKEVAADSTEVKDALVNAAKGGTTVELYYNDDDKDAVDCVTILNYSIGQIKDVSTKLTKDQKDDGATSKIKVEGKWYLDNDVVGFDSKTYVEDAYVLYILKSTTEMSASQIAEEITGKVTAIKGSDKATIDGTQYKYVKNAVTIDVDDEGSFYLNAAGQIAAVDTDSKSDNYAFIYNLKKDTNKVNSDGVLADTITAYYVTTDGTKASAVVDADVETTSGEKTFYYADTKTEVESGVVIAFSINSDGELVLETEKDTIKNNVTKTIDKTHAAGTDSDTQFIFAYADGSKFKTSTATGYKNVSVKGQQVCTVTNKDGDYLYVFVGVKNGTLSSDVQYAVVTDGKASKTKDGKDTFYSYDAIINGEESTLTFKTSTDPKLTKGAAYAFELDGKNVKDNKVTQLNFAQVTAGTKNYVEVGGTQYNLDDDVKAIYTVTLEYKSEAAYNEATKGTTLTFADLDSVTVSEGADIDNKSWVAYNVDGSDLDVLFVVDFVY